MREIKCPKCGSTITVNEADYESIVSQVKNAEFNAEIERRLKEMAAQKEAESKASMAEVNSRHLAELNKKQQEIAALKSELSQSDNNLKIALLKEQQKVQQDLQTKDAKINELMVQAELDKSQAELKAQGIKDEYERKLSFAQEQIDYYKDLKSKLSTKMVGETLEVHCSTEFETKVRPYMKGCYFEKDNDASGGSKGDFIFRGFEGKTEYISIMFEMKNEMDTTASKHKNEDFFKKLDEDRTSKKCEYAVLVSLLEPESDLYNAGIVDVSHKYPKMYVVRPQFFVPIITLLSQAAQANADIKRQLIEAQNQSIDVTNFETKLKEMQVKFSDHYDKAEKYFGNVLDDIDKTIKALEKIKTDLTTTGNQLRLANNSLSDITIKKLTRGNPTMKAKFDEVSK